MKVWLVGERDDGTRYSVTIHEKERTGKAIIFGPSPVPAVFRWVAIDGEMYDLTTGEPAPSRLSPD